LSRGLMLRDGSKFLSLAIPVGGYRPSRAALARITPLFASVGARDRRRVRSAFSGHSTTRRRDGEEKEGRYQEEERRKETQGRREEEEARLHLLTFTRTSVQSQR